MVIQGACQSEHVVRDWQCPFGKCSSALNYLTWSLRCSQDSIDARDAQGATDASSVTVRAKLDRNPPHSRHTDTLAPARSAAALIKTALHDSILRYNSRYRSRARCSTRLKCRLLNFRSAQIRSLSSSSI